MKSKLVSRLQLLALLSLFFPGIGHLQAQCCDEDDSVMNPCETQAKAFADRFLAITASPLFNKDPASDPDELEGQLNAIKKQNPALHKQFISEVKAYTKWFKPDEGNYAGCVYQFIDEDHERNKDWIVETTSMLGDFKKYSPEFCRGIRFHVEMGMGVKDLGANSESFMGSLSALASYTFAPTDPNASIDPDIDRLHCNGCFRIAAGISESYVDLKGLTQGLVRLEYKLFDLKTEFFSIGNVKAIGQGAFGLNRDFHTLGLGIGAETEIITMHLLYGIGLQNVKSTLQLSFVYNSKLIKS